MRRHRDAAMARPGKRAASRRSSWRLCTTNAAARPSTAPASQVFQPAASWSTALWHITTSGTPARRAAAASQPKPGAK
jgi:hypothetical protein